MFDFSVPVTFRCGYSNSRELTTGVVLLSNECDRRDAEYRGSDTVGTEARWREGTVSTGSNHPGDLVPVESSIDRIYRTDVPVLFLFLFLFPFPIVNTCRTATATATANRDTNWFPCQDDLTQGKRGRCGLIISLQSQPGRVHKLILHFPCSDVEPGGMQESTSRRIPRKE